MTHVEPMDPNQAFAELGRIRLADVDIDVLLDKIAQLAVGEAEHPTDHAGSPTATHLHATPAHGALAAQRTMTACTGRAFTSLNLHRAMRAPPLFTR